MSPTRRDILKASSGAVTAALVATGVATSAAEPLRIESLPYGMMLARLSDGQMVTLRWDQEGGQFQVGENRRAMRELDDPKAIAFFRKQNEVMLWLSLNGAGIEVESDAVPSHVTYDTL